MSALKTKLNSSNHDNQENINEIGLFDCKILISSSFCGQMTLTKLQIVETFILMNVFGLHHWVTIRSSFSLPTKLLFFNKSHEILWLKLVKS